MPIAMKQSALLLVACATLAPLCLPGAARGGELSVQESRMFEMHEVSLWLRARFSEAELQALGPQASRVEAHACGCYDKPRPHYPYRLVLFTTPKGDLVARAESHESALRITPLAVRKGTHYYELESEERSYGAFAHPCDFTDFRYGPHLEAFFPSCKGEEKRTSLPAARPERQRLSRSSTEAARVRTQLGCRPGLPILGQRADRPGEMVVNRGQLLLTPARSG